MKKTEEKVLSFIDGKKLIQRNDNILIGLSGGPDSVFLFHFLLKFRNRFKINIGAVHVNHMLRGKEANEDEMFCRELCGQYSVPFYVIRKNVKEISDSRKISLEEAGRVVRYDIFEKMASKHGYSKIATAHNCNDNAETVMLNLIKGAGLKGLAGIPFKRGKIIRPVLSLTKKEILNYLNSKKLSYRLDSSNLESDFERNFLRNELFPSIRKKLNPVFEEKLFNTSEIIKEASFQLGKIVDNAISDSLKIIHNKLNISISNLKNFDEYFYADIFRKPIEDHFNFQLNYINLNELVKLVKKTAGSHILLPGNFEALRDRNEIIIQEIKPEKLFEKIEVKIGNSVKINSQKFSIIKKDKYLIDRKDNNTEYISADNVDEKFYIRRWVNGDRFHPIGLKGTKKVSDFLNEQKLSSIEKKKQLVLTNKNKIVWILGMRLDDRFKITKNTQRVVQLCLK